MGDQGPIGDAQRMVLGRLSRRALLVRAGALGCSTSALAVLIACGGTSKAASQPTAIATMIMPATTRAATTRAAGSVAAAPSGPQVGIDNFNFSPKSLSVPVGA